MPGLLATTGLATTGAIGVAGLATMTGFGATTATGFTVGAVVPVRTGGRPAAPRIDSRRNVISLQKSDVIQNDSSGPLPQARHLAGLGG